MEVLRGDGFSERSLSCNQRAERAHRVQGRQQDECLLFLVKTTLLWEGLTRRAG